MVYADPYKLEAHQLSLMDVVRSVNNANLILPAGDVQIGPLDYNIYTNSQLRTVAEINNLPMKMVGAVAGARRRHRLRRRTRSRSRPTSCAWTASASVYLPVLKQGGDTNTIAVVDGIKRRRAASVRRAQGTGHARWCSISRVFVKTAIETLLHEGAIGLFLTSIMILVFLGSMRATVAVFFSIPLSALAAFIALSHGRRLDQQHGAGRTGAGIFAADRQLGGGAGEHLPAPGDWAKSPAVAAEKGGREVALPVLAATLTTVVVFFPVTFLYGVSKFLFSALALAVVLSLFASYAVAMTVVPLFCARFIKAPAHHGTPSDGDPGHGGPCPQRSVRLGDRFNVWFNDRFESFLQGLRPAGRRRRCGGPVADAGGVRRGLRRQPRSVSAARPLLLPAHRCRPVRHQPESALAARGCRVTENEVAKVEDLIRQVVSPEDLGMIVSNIGATPGFLGHLHHQLRHAHRVRAGEPEGRSQDRQLRIHGAREAADRRRSCRS